MDTQELQKTLASLGLSQSEAARTLGIDPRSMRRYIAGDRHVPPPTAKLLRLLVARPELLPLVKEKTA